jgi:hypothetical protein
MKQTKAQNKKELKELKKIEAAIKEGFAESEKYLKKEAEKKCSGFQLCLG